MKTPVVDADTTPPPLPWLAAPLASVLAQQRGHATLVQGAAGVGAFEFVLALAQTLLCEGPTPDVATLRTAPCGHCGSCHLVQAGLHADLFVLLPENQRREKGWLLVEDKSEGEELKRKPSRQIRIDEVRSLIDWSHKTSARGRGKVALVHPADAMNVQSASALLKTLEEPPVGTRLLLTTADASSLLPTVRSRCQHVLLPAPSASMATAWLAGQGVTLPDVLLAACTGRPLDALSLVRAGVDAAAWTALPAAVASGQSAGLQGWPPPLLLDALHKLCHDALARSVGGAACYFPAAGVPAHASVPALLEWAQALARITRHADHPWNEGLLLEALVQQGRYALANAQPAKAGPSGVATQAAATLPR